MILTVVLLAVLSAQAQTAPSHSAPGDPCGATSKTDPAEDGILSDTQGVDFKFFLSQFMRITRSNWEPLMPKEAKPPVNKTGEVAICVKLLPNGHVMDGGMVLEGRSGDVALDRAAWGAIATAVYPPLPVEFKGAYLALRLHFMYNPPQKPASSRKTPKPRTLPGPLGLTLGYSSKL